MRIQQILDEDVYAFRDSNDLLEAEVSHRCGSNFFSNSWTWVSRLVCFAYVCFSFVRIINIVSGHDHSDRLAHFAVSIVLLVRGSCSNSPVLSSVNFVMKCLACY